MKNALSAEFVDGSIALEASDVIEVPLLSMDETMRVIEQVPVLHHPTVDSARLRSSGKVRGSPRPGGQTRRIGQ